MSTAVSPEWTPYGPDALREALADRIAALPGVVRVAVDGAPATDPGSLATELVEPLRARSRAAVHVSADGFLHDASLRFEHGRDDPESYLGWLDHDALRREVLVPAAQDHRYLPSLRDPVSNRSTRESPRPLPADGVVLVSGSLLLGLGLPFDLVVHLHLTADALAGRTPPDRQWTLEAYADYERTVSPLDVCDVAVRVGRRTPAVRGLAVTQGRP